ncbi:MAG TPA: hypothetical protein VFO10_19615 [Oligoflexus sp.]|uniref:hypothetical protein n=1 Tax=Oligoflexus sp. TaxID=1971216 RepID=UPI002D7E85E0|nr:hypothetical protein [Oligoflexus sp.]HET9239480.1 hypothetical protein [Oligoflexus sp.]
MIHKLIHPFEYKGETYTAISLPDAARFRHQVASLRVARDAAEKSAGLKVDLSLSDDALLNPDIVRMLEINLESDRAMIEAFCADLPADALDELSIEDMEVINAHIRRLMHREAKVGEAEHGKKPIRPGRSA